MKLRTLFSALALIALFHISCDDSADNLGKEIQPTEDEIVVGVDTFYLSTETVMVNNIISRPDSFLLGKFADNKFGTITGEIMTELLLFKDGFTFPESSKAITKVDSVMMTITFNSTFGNVASPFHIGVFELKDTLSRYENYNSDVDPTPYVDYNKLIGDTVFSVKDGTTGAINSQIRFHMKPDFVNRFFTTNPEHYKNQNEFRKFFKGLFITTDYYGSAVMINVQSVRLSMYYNYIFHEHPNDTLYAQQNFYASPEVKRVNRIRHLERTINIDPNDEYNYIASPANYYTSVKIPLDRVRQKVDIPGKMLNINRASIKINVRKNQDNADPSLTWLPYINNLLLITKDSVDRFFSERRSLSNSYTFLASRDSTYISPNNYDYTYSFNGLSTLIEKEIKNKNNTSSYIDMVLIPVSLRYTTSGYETVLSEVNQSNQLQSVTIFGGKHATSPMKLEVIYSGF